MTKISRYFLLPIVFVAQITLCAQAQEQLPNFEGVDLNEKNLTFPQNLKGKKSLVGFAFSRKAQEDLESWAQPVYDEFIDKESLASLVYDANVFLVIVFNKFNASVRKKAIREMKENILREFYGNIVLSEKMAEEMTDELDISNKDIPTLFTLDEEGNISGIFTGRYSSKKMEELSALLERE